MLSYQHWVNIYLPQTIDHKNDSWHAYCGHIETLRVHPEHYRWNNEVCAAAIVGDQFETLMYLLSVNAPCDEYTSYCAARQGRVDMLNILKEINCPFPECLIGMARREMKPDPTFSIEVAIWFIENFA